MLYPELKIIGGKKKLKNDSCEKVNIREFESPKASQKSHETNMPTKMVAPVS